MAQRSVIDPEAHLPLHRLHVQRRWMRADVRNTARLPLLRLAGAVLVALLALATASGLTASS